VIFAEFVARLEAIERLPVHTSCNPARMATMARAVLSLFVGILLASKHPSTTPGTPPRRSSKSIGMADKHFNCEGAILLLFA